MSTTAISKYASNQFNTATVERFPLMSEIVSDCLSRSAIAAAGNALYATVNATLITVGGAWSAGEITLANAEANGPSTTLAFDDKMDGLTRQPDINTASILDGWVTTIATQAIPGSVIYVNLLPNGRETLTVGGREAQLDAGAAFGTRLTAQTSKPTLVSLGTVVSTFYTAARALRTAQTNAKTTLDNARALQEPLRVAAANAIYALVGQAMVVHNSNPVLVDTVFNLDFLRGDLQTLPGPPTDTTWTPATRTLATTAMPADATRLEAWRVGPGGMPELLLIGLPGVTALIIPASITFTPGNLYQLWIQARNSRGSSPAGPVQNWTP